MNRLTVSLLLICLCLSPLAAEELFQVPAGVSTRWYSFENPTAAKGAGGQSNQTRKGASSKDIAAGEIVTLADIQGPGVIRRIWMTVRNRPENLRGLVLRIYWENQDYPSVEAPLQDFFGIPFARQAAFESALFSNPEGRSFNCFIPMPFKTRALVTIENQAPDSAGPLFYDIDCTVGDNLPADLCYFHARYRRENQTTPKKDFQILPRVEGRGRYLGCNVGVRTVGQYGQPTWFGEGEMKIYLDGDREYPTLVGTGTEDLLGSAWGLGPFNHLYQGCLVSDNGNGVWAFYRYHIPDPVYFQKEIQVDLQQMQGAMTSELKEKISAENYPELVPTHKRFNPADYSEDTWQNFEAPQDVCATAYWYQSLPSPKWGPLEPYASRMKDLLLPPKP